MIHMEHKKSVDNGVKNGQLYKNADNSFIFSNQSYAMTAAPENFQNSSDHHFQGVEINDNQTDEIMSMDGASMAPQMSDLDMDDQSLN